MKKLAIICLAMCFIFSDCKKRKEHRYPEDPKATTIPPKSRLTGQWGINKYTLNGSDIISSLEGIFNNKYKISDVIFGYDKDLNDRWILIISAANSKNSVNDAFEEPDKITLGPD